VAEIAAPVRTSTTATTTNRDGVDQEEGVPPPFVIVGVTLPNPRQTTSTGTCQGRATGVVQAGETKDGKVAGVQEREENGAGAGAVIVVEEAETGQNGATTDPEWSTGDHGKRKRSWTRRWTTTGVLPILERAVRRSRPATTAPEMTRLPQPPT
jgi:hypothetical protein